MEREWKIGQTNNQKRWELLYEPHSGEFGSEAVHEANFAFGG